MGFCQNLSVFVVLLAVGIYFWPRSSGHSLPESNFGVEPKLPQPESQLLPTVNFVKIRPWAGKQPIAPEGFQVTAFRSGLEYPRWIHVLPNGDVLVAESRTLYTERNIVDGLIGHSLIRESRMFGESANRISLLRDLDSDGIAEFRTDFATNLSQVFGMAYSSHDNSIFIATTDSIYRYDNFVLGSNAIGDENRVKIADLPAGGYNNHWTRNLIIDHQKRKLYVSIGSASNIAEDGFDIEISRACIVEMNFDGSERRIFGGGLRNPVGMDFNPETKQLWTVVNERDELGDDLVPDYLTSVRDGSFFGWPYSYWGKIVDSRVQPQNEELVRSSIEPDYALGAHTASLGLAFYYRNEFPSGFRNGAFIGQHGSWNRRAFSGYKVIFVPFENGKPAGKPIDFLTGFLRDNDPGTAFGRPAGVAVDTHGGLLVADDAGDTVWLVRAKLD